MPQEITLVKTLDGALRGSTEMDSDLIRKWKPGNAIKVQAVKLRPRSLDYHRRYFAGLLGLAMHYWEPAGGLLAPSEVSTLNGFAGWLDKKGGNTGAIRMACSEFLQELAGLRAESIQAPEKSIDGLHRWIKEQCGYYDIVLMPNGIRKEVKSINFNAMDQDEFCEFYKKAFNVVWKFILSRKFENKSDAENAVSQLLSLG